MGKAPQIALLVALTSLAVTPTASQTFCESGGRDCIPKDGGERMIYQGALFVEKDEQRTGEARRERDQRQAARSAEQQRNADRMAAAELRRADQALQLETATRQREHGAHSGVLVVRAAGVRLGGPASMGAGTAHAGQPPAPMGGGNLGGRGGPFYQPVPGGSPGNMRTGVPAANLAQFRSQSQPPPGGATGPSRAR